MDEDIRRLTEDMVSEIESWLTDADTCPVFPEWHDEQGDAYQKPWMLDSRTTDGKGTIEFTYLNDDAPTERVTLRVTYKVEEVKR